MSANFCTRKFSQRNLFKIKFVDLANSSFRFRSVHSQRCGKVTGVASATDATNANRRLVTVVFHPRAQVSQSPMSLVMFKFAIEHVSRVARVLKQDNGHLLLIGIGGSGRKSVTRLASFMADYEIYTIELTR